jgi:hypothetical protein
MRRWIKDFVESALSADQEHFSRRILVEPSLQKRENLRLSRTEPEVVKR